MKGVILAVAMSIGMLPAAPIASEAASTTVTIQTDNYYRHHDRGLHRGWYKGKHYGWKHRRHCRTKTVVHWRHHHRVVERIRVCR